MSKHDRPIVRLDDHNIVSIDEDALIAEDQLPVAHIQVFNTFLSVFLRVSLDVVINSEQVYISNFQFVRPL